MVSNSIGTCNASGAEYGLSAPMHEAEKRMGPWISDVIPALAAWGERIRAVGSTVGPNISPPCNTSADARTTPFRECCATPLKFAINTSLHITSATSCGLRSGAFHVQTMSQQSFQNFSQQLTHL